MGWLDNMDDVELSENVKRRVMWRKVFDGKAMRLMNTPAAMYGRLMRSIEFVMPPLMLGKKPMLVIVDGCILKPHGSSAASESILKGRNVSDYNSLVDELCSKRRVYVGRTGGKDFTRNGEAVHVRKKSVYSKSGSEYMDKCGFERVGVLGENGDGTASADFNPVLLFIHITECAMYAVHSAVHKACGVRFDEGGEKFGVSQEGYALLMKLVGVCLVMDGDVSASNCERLLKVCMYPGSDIEVVMDYLRSMRRTVPHIITGSGDRLLHATGNVTTPMPSARGWGYMTPVTSDAQRKYRGETAHGIVDIVMSGFVSACDRLRDCVDYACKAVQHYIDNSDIDEKGMSYLIDCVAMFHDTASDRLSAECGTTVEELTTGSDVDEAEQRRLYNKITKEYDTRELEAKVMEMSERSKVRYQINAVRQHSGALMRDMISGLE